MTINDRQEAYEKIYKFLGPEDKLHIECAIWLFTKYPTKLWFHPPNEGKRNWVEQIKLKLMGVRSGVLDFVFLEPNAYYFGLILECKVKYTGNTKSYSTKQQKWWIDQLKQKGFSADIFYEKSEFIQKVNNYFSTAP